MSSTIKVKLLPISNKMSILRKYEILHRFYNIYPYFIESKKRYEVVIFISCLLPGEKEEFLRLNILGDESK